MMTLLLQLSVFPKSDRHCQTDHMCSCILMFGYFKGKKKSVEIKSFFFLPSGLCLLRVHVSQMENSWMIIHYATHA